MSAGGAPLAPDRGAVAERCLEMFDWPSTQDADPVAKVLAVRDRAQRAGAEAMALSTTLETGRPQWRALLARSHRQRAGGEKCERTLRGAGTVDYRQPKTQALSALHVGRTIKWLK